MSGQHSISRPSLVHWREWAFSDYVRFFLSKAAMKARLLGERPAVASLPEGELAEFCAPIRARITRLFSGKKPRISIQIPAYNEEGELIPTIVALSLLDLDPDTAELIVADNKSTDQTRSVIEACGARYVRAPVQGIGPCRRSAYEAMSKHAEYIWLTDADARVVGPITSEAGLTQRSTLLRRSLNHLERHKNVIGVSTGGVIEGSHWLYSVVRTVSLRLGRSSPFSCWSGCNQFIRRWALDEIGGIDPSVDFGEDHHRHYELARLGKRKRLQLDSANRDPSLADPVYYSGRRYSTAWLVLRHYTDVLRRQGPTRDEFGYPVHEKEREWRYVRLGE